MAGAPLGTRTAAKQSESKSKLMPNLFESRGLRRLWATLKLSRFSFRFTDKPADTLGRARKTQEIQFL
jgi:hypothetical protein